MFRAPLCPSSGAREYYTGGCCLRYLVLWFSSCRYGVELRVVCPVCRLLQQPANRTQIAPTGIRCPDRPARSESLYLLSYPGPHSHYIFKIKNSGAWNGIGPSVSWLDYGLDDWEFGIWSPALSLLQSLHISSAVHPASYPMATGELFACWHNGRWVKQTTQLHPLARLRNSEMEPYLHSPILTHHIMLN